MIQENLFALSYLKLFLQNNLQQEHSKRAQTTNQQSNYWKKEQTTVEICEINSGLIKKAMFRNINVANIKSVFFFVGLDNQNEFFENFVKKNILISLI